MSTVRIDAARPDDDAGLRALLRVPVPGQVTLGFEREPAYFAADAILGERCETFVARDGDAVVGLVSAARRRLHVGGEVTECGYLSQLRVARSHEGRGLVALGLRAVRARLAETGVPGAYATVSKGNRAAEGVLLRRFGRGPAGFAPVAELWTLAYAATPVRPRWRQGELATATPDDLQEVADFLTRHGPQRQLYPAVGREGPLAGRPGLRVDDLVLARSRGALRGVVAVWDQSALRQTVVRGYGPALGRLKPWLDVGRRIRGGRALPAVGEPLRVASASLFTVAADDAAVASALIAAAVAAAARRGAHALALTLDAVDPLLRVARRRPHVAYGSQLVALPLADPEFVRRLEGTRFVDAGTL